MQKVPSNVHDKNKYSSFYDKIGTLESRTPEELYAKIGRVANSSYFKETSVESFREEFCACLQELLLLSSIKENKSTFILPVVSSYDIQIVEKCLFPIQDESDTSFVIDWRDLCQDYDTNCDRLKSYYDDSKSQPKNEIFVNESRYTALEEIVNIILNSNIFPPCFIETIVLMFTRVLVEVASTLSTKFQSNNNKEDTTKVSLTVLEKSVSGNFNTCELSSSAKFIRTKLQAFFLLKPNISLLKPFKSYYVETIVCRFNDSLLNSFDGQNINGIQKGPSGITPMDMQQVIRLSHFLSLSLWILEFFPSISRGCAIVLFYKVVQVIVKLDTLDMKLLEKYHQRQKKLKKKRIHCQNCDFRNGNDNSFGHYRMKRRQKTSTLSDLHETSMSMTDGAFLTHFERRQYIPKKEIDTTTGCPYNAFMNSDSDERLCNDCFALFQRLANANIAQKWQKELVVQQKVREMTRLSYQMVQLRSILYQSMVKIFTYIPFKNQILNNITTMSCYRIQNPSLRLCSLLIASHCKNTYLSLLQCLLKVFQKRINTTNYSTRQSKLAKTSVLIYGEILVEVRFFDDPKNFWKGIKPLLDTALFLNKQMNKSSNFCPTEQEKTSTVSKLMNQSDQYGPNRLTENEIIISLIKWLLLNIAHVLVRRRHCLTSTACDREPISEWNDYILKYSLAFDDVNMWTDHCTSFDERVEITTTLQALGIISLFCHPRENNDKSHVIDSSSLGHQWPFPEPSLISSVTRRAGRKGQYDKLLSCQLEGDLRTDNCIASTNTDEEQKTNNINTVGKVEERRIPMTNYIHSDMLNVVFSFLGYKSLNKVSCVSKEWNEMSREENLWRYCYMRKFKAKFHEQLLPKGLPCDLRSEMIKSFTILRGSWRSLFASKWRREKCLRFNYDKDGRKCGTCDYIGCYEVSINQQEKEKHEKIHNNAVQNELRKVIKLKTDCLKEQTRILKHNYDQQMKSLKVKIQIEIGQLQVIHDKEKEIFSIKLQEEKQSLLREHGKIPVRLVKLHNQRNFRFNKRIKIETGQLKLRHKAEKNQLKTKFDRDMRLIICKKEELRIAIIT